MCSIFPVCTTDVATSYFRADRSGDLAPADVTAIGARRPGVGARSLSVVNNGHWRCIPARKRTERPSQRTREIPKNVRSRGCNSAGTRHADRERVRCACADTRARVFARAAGFVDDDDGENEDNGDAGREIFAAWRRARTARRSDTHGRALKPREENRARFPGARIPDERRRKRRQRNEETVSSSWTWKEEGRGSGSGRPDRSPREFECERFRNCQPSWSRESITVSRSLFHLSFSFFLFLSRFLYISSLTYAFRAD